MAELYFKQGHREEAIAIYQRLVAQNPNEPQLRQRLAEISGGSMNFRESLQRMVDSVPGAVSAMIMGFDGIAIDSFDRGSSTIDLPSLLIEYSGATQQLRQAAAATPQIGALTELTITRVSGTCLLRPLSDEYFLAVVLGPSALVGKARFMMRMLSPSLIRELT